ncbi:MAG TPA: elongation factor P maturation arginine rhamnosyltransferase EarP [Methylotenera sp.]|nr:elongation factor P maturation arginine rhamnosyltransferase EarP [Methylotenera sp.]
MIKPGKNWDIFCKIVDNYGDIGICWRLAKQLAHEHALNVRLFIDEVSVAKKIIPDLDVDKPQQTVNRVQVVTWASIGTNQIALDKVDVVLETFGCELSAHYLQHLSPETVWINLEYLSAENWVSEFHAKPSRHPTLPLTKHFFFPGFFEDTGGLIREHDLISQRDVFLASQVLQKDYWQRVAGVEIDTSAINISLFCYPQATIKNLIEGLKTSDQKINLFIPIGNTVKDISSIFVDKNLDIGDVFQQGNVTIQVLPFLSQDDYDRLLWACDLNFVRGEDSWIRAIWAAKPFVWQPYIQADDAHLVKLNAFLDFYTQDLSDETKTLINQTHLSWSGYVESNTTDNIWLRLIDQLSSIAIINKTRADTLSAQADLATKLVMFSEKLQKNQV